MLSSRFTLVACLLCILSSVLIGGAGIIGKTRPDIWTLYTLQSVPGSRQGRIAITDMERLLTTTFYVDDGTIARTPRLTPDRSHIIFEGIGGTIQIMDSAHPENVLDFPPATLPVWSSQHQNFALRVDRHLYLTTDGTTLTRITDYDDSMSEFSPQWSPDGEQLAFLVQFSTPNGQRSEIHIRDANHSIHSISHDATFNDYFPVWSSDGERLAFIAQRNDTLTLMVMDADGRNRYAPANLPLLNVGSVTWSPDGTVIALIATRRRGSRLYLIDPNGRNETISATITRPVFNTLVWSPDSSHLAFSLQETGAIYLLTVASGDVRQITDPAQTNIMLP